jgi:hypothetical protein
MLPPPRENVPTMSRATEAALRNDLAEARRDNQRLRDRIEAAEVRRQKQVTVTWFGDCARLDVFVPELDRVVSVWVGRSPHPLAEEEEEEEEEG